jgi:hypothetical protein
MTTPDTVGTIRPRQHADEAGTDSVRYLAKEAEEADPGVEAGLARLLLGGSTEAERAPALDTFELNALCDLSNEVEAEPNLVIPMVDRTATWATPGELAGTQMRIEHWLERVSVPLVGFPRGPHLRKSDPKEPVR